MYAVFGFASRDFSLSPHPAKSNAAKTIRNDRVLIRRKSERNKLSSRNRQATWCPVPEIAGILPEVSWLFFKAVRAGLAVKHPYLSHTGRASNAEKQTTGPGPKGCEKMGRRPRCSSVTYWAIPVKSFPTSDDPFVAAVNRNLRSRCLGEARTTQFCNDLSDVAACDLGSEDIIRFVLLDRNPVTGGPLLQDFLCPDPRVEHSVRVNRVNTNPVDSPFERSDAGQLSQSSLRSRVGGLTNTRSRHVLRCIDHDPPSLGSQSEKLMRKPE